MTRPTNSLTHETLTTPAGRTLSYAVGGDPDGPAVVVNHGTPGSRLFGALLEETATDVGVRTVIPDRPGYGASSPPPDDWTWQDWPADLELILEAEPIDSAAVLGFSGGGPFAFAAGQAEWTTRVALVSSVIPPADTPLARLSTVPFALRALFRVSDWLASVRGPESVVRQYTSAPVAEAIVRAVAADFHEGLRQGAAAVARENRAFARNAVAPRDLNSPLRAWHGTADTNAPIGPVRQFVHEADGEFVSTERDHLGTLLDTQQAVLEWLVGSG
jgi:pimeloyl-ACP methyl ester carboxylesterase